MTREEAERIIVGLLQRARANFERDGDLVSVAFILAARAPDGRVLDPPGLVIMPTPWANVEEKDRYVAKIAELAEQTKAIGVFFLNEAWWKVVGPGEAGARAVRRAARRGVEREPERQEVIVLSAEHLAWKGVRMWKADITRDETGAPTLGPFAELPEMSETTGRMFGLLPVRH